MTVILDLLRYEQQCFECLKYVEFESQAETIKQLVTIIEFITCNKSMNKDGSRFNNQSVNCTVLCTY